MKRVHLVRVQDRAPAELSRAQLVPGPVIRARVLRLDDQGLIVVAGTSAELQCEVLESQSGAALAPGDTVMVAMPDAIDGFGVVLGRVCRHKGEATARVVVAASQSLTLQCGESSIDLRADGKVVIRGDDVLVRAKGTKRIRAGSVSIN